MQQAFLNDFKGSISELIMQNREQNTVVANTPEEQARGVEGMPEGTRMIFPNVTPGQEINTMNTGSVKATQYDANNNPLDSGQVLPSGIVGKETHPQIETLVEEVVGPNYKSGGYARKETDWKPGKGWK